MKSDVCKIETKYIGNTQPNYEEKKGFAGVVELHQCQKCQKIQRFPRYY
jgi:hypothetical protein